jgi:hypothetical protein
LEIRPASNNQERCVVAQTQPFRIQFVRVSSGQKTLLLGEVQIEASDASAAIIAAACAAWPPQTKELRILDRNGRQVFERKANGRQPSRGRFLGQLAWSLPGRSPRDL